MKTLTELIFEGDILVAKDTKKPISAVLPVTAMKIITLPGNRPNYVGTNSTFLNMVEDEQFEKNMLETIAKAAPANADAFMNHGSREYAVTIMDYPQNYREALLFDKWKGPPPNKVETKKTETYVSIQYYRIIE